MGSSTEVTAARGRGCGSAARAALGRALVAGVSVCLLAACSGPDGAGRRLGDDLGTFSVDANEVDGSCGAGAVGSAPSFQFDVELTRADAELFWDGRIGGTIDANLAFELAASVGVEVRPARGADPGCNVVRTDFISGVLHADASDQVVGLSGSMRFEFAAADGSACTPDDAAAAELARLPCRLSYALEGTRTRAPGP
jgi:hypothetical protein